MHDKIDKVQSFHEKHGFASGQPMSAISQSEEEKVKAFMLTVAGKMKSWSEALETGTIAGSQYDDRLMRMHLILEEAAETFVGMASRDELATLDGLADLVYVVLGTAVAFDLPLATAFDEVHRSNMTKEVKAGGDDDIRVRVKGDSYEPPRLDRIMQATYDRRENGASS